MNYIVSETLRDKFNNYTVVRSIAVLLDKDDIGAVILHSTSEAPFKVGMAISELHTKKGISKFAYLNDTPDAMIRLCISGLGGLIIEDEWYFEDEAELDILLTEYIEEELAIVPTYKNNKSFYIVSDFIQAFIRKDKRIYTNFYLETVQSAIKNLGERIQQKDLVIDDLGESASRIFHEASIKISEMQKARLDLDSRLKELMETANAQSMSPRSNTGSVFYFPSVSHMSTAKVIQIREVSPCRYLTSFILAFRDYLRGVHGKSAKVIVVHQKGRGVLKRYSWVKSDLPDDNFTSITEESKGNRELYSSRLVNTNVPQRDVIIDLLKDEELVIVIDRLYSNEGIVRSRVKTFYGVSGASDLKRFSLNPNQCIFSVREYPNCLAYIPTILDYSDVIDTRRGQYQRVCESTFDKLAKRFEIIT